MPITESQYKLWLRNPHNIRCLLVIIEGYNLTTDLVESFYLSNTGYQTKPTDSVPNIAFSPDIKGDPFFSNSIPFYQARGEIDTGTIEIDNTNAKYDSWLGYSFVGRPIKIYMYDPKASFDDFIVFPIIEGVIEDIEFENTETVSLKIKNWMYRLDKPIEEDLLVSPSPSENEPIPLTFGLVRNIQPVLIDANELGGRYAINNGQVNDILNVYDNGVLLSPPNSLYTKYNATGQCVLKKRPVGTVTMDVQGTVDVSWINTISDIVKHIVTQHGGLTTSELDTTSFSDFNTAMPCIVGMYIKERQNILDVMDILLGSVGGYYVGLRNSKLKIGYIQDTSLFTPIAYFGGFGNDLIIDNSVSIKKLNDVEWRSTIGYQRNWTIQTADDLAGSISDPDFPDKNKVVWLGKTSFTASAETISVKSKYLSSIEAEKYETLIDDATDAQSEVDYRHSILSKQCRLVSFSAYTTPLQLNPGDIIYIEFERFSLAHNIQILQLKDFYTLGIVEITGWLNYTF